jgi:hypothetical protein
MLDGKKSTHARYFITVSSRSMQHRQTRKTLSCMSSHPPLSRAGKSFTMDR